MEKRELKNSFEAVGHPATEVLILGSLPGDRSLEVQQYYGHPRNRFWTVIERIVQEEVPAVYPQRLALLQRHRIALWDVAQQAFRPGSLDTAMRGIVPNALHEWLEQHPKVHTIGFNGQKAEQVYDRHFVRQAQIRYIRLPSTSPANAAYSLDRLVESWQLLLTDRL